MKVYQKILFLMGILILVGIHRYLFAGNEGFFDTSSDYNTLKKRLSETMSPYCKISSFIQDQLTTMITATKDTTDIDSIYKEIYSCSDKLASSRRSCASPNMSMAYVNCDTYMKLPTWSSDGSSTMALMKITDDLPERLVREAEWFAAIIKQLNETLALGANPPTSAPSEYKTSQMEPRQLKNEGFTGSPTCSPEAAEYQRSQRLRKEAGSCSIPSITSEIQRVNSLLNSPSLKNSLARMNGLLDAMLKIQSDLEKAKNGTLYPWQQDGPPKKYPSFQGGDRTAGLLFSMQQNQF